VTREFRVTPLLTRRLLHRPILSDLNTVLRFSMRSEHRELQHYQNDTWKRKYSLPVEPGLLARI
jgi:hypothetical protein